MEVRLFPVYELPHGERVGLCGCSHRVAEQERVVPVVVAPFQFVQIGGHVLHGHLVVAADDAALEQRPDVFNGLRVNVTTHSSR